MPVSVLLYCAAFHYSYIKWISPVWAYGGLTYKTPAPALLALAYALAALLCAVSPLKLRRPSHAIYWMLYFTVYIPGLFVPLFVQLDPDFSLFLLQLSLAGGMLVIALSYRFPLLTFRRYPLDPSLFWGICAVVYLVGNGALLAVYHNNLHFASVETMYSLRHQAGRVLEENPAIGYVSRLMANVMDPLLMAYGLVNHRNTLTVLGVMGELLVYSTASAKASFLSPFLVAGLYYTIKSDRGGWVPKLGLSLAGAFLGLTTLVIGAKPGVLFDLASVTLVRTFATPGVLMGDYYHFFENRQHTHLGNVTGLSLLATNPYTLSVGVEMGAYYGFKESSERGRVNENANFFATDGIAGFGLPGILMMGTFCAAVFWVLDSSAKSYSMEFSVPALAMVMLSITNVSLFTTLLGNGLIAWVLLFMIMPRSRIGADEPAHTIQNCG